MTINEKDQIRRFMENPTMNQAVMAFIKETFEKKRVDREVHMLAGQMIAIELLQQAYKDMETYKKRTETASRQAEQIAL